MGLICSFGYTLIEIMGNTASTASSMGRAGIESYAADKAQQTSGRQRTPTENVVRAVGAASNPIVAAAVIYSDIAEAATAQNSKIMDEARKQCAKGGDKWAQEYSAAMASPMID